MTDNVRIAPLPPAFRGLKKFRPLPRPVFERPPSRADVLLALALFQELDVDSQLWYGHGFADRLRARLEGS